MRKIFLSIFLLLSVFAYALREVNGVLYREYQNERFGYVVEYPPEILFIQPAPTDNDGRTFLSEDQDSEMLIYGTYFLSPSTDSGNNDMKKMVVDNYYYVINNDYSSAKITYQKLNQSDGWYVVSGILNGKVFYHKVRAVPGADAYFLVFDMKYPMDQKDIYDKLLDSITKSIKF